MTRPRVRWLEFLFMPLALAIIVVAWFNPVVAWFTLVTSPDRSMLVPSPLWMVSVILGSTFLTRYVLTRKVKHPRIWIVSGGLAAMIVTAIAAYRGPSLLRYGQDLLNWDEAISPEFVVLIAGGALWWRGILIGRSQSLVEENLERTFFNGVVALALLLYFNNLANRLATSDLLVAVLTFFAASLAALMIVNVERTRLQHTDVGFQFNRHWVSTLIGVVGAILLGAVALAGIFSPDALREFGNSLRPVISAIGGVLASLLVFVVNLIWRLIEPLLPLIVGFFRLLLEIIRRLAETFDRLGFSIDLNSLQTADSFLRSQTFEGIVRGTLTFIALIVLVLAMIWALYRSGLLARQNFEEVHDSIASRELLLNQLKHLLSRLRRKREAEKSLYLPLSGNDPRQAVRRTYQEFLEWARVRIRARAPYQTPTLYAQRIGDLSEAQQEPVGQLTALYLRARYADDQMTPDDVQAAQSALIRLQETPVIQSPLTAE